MIMQRISIPFAVECLNTDRNEEAQTGIIEMPEDEPIALAALIQYLYTCDYSLDTTGRDGALLAHAKVYGIADKYCLPSLKQLAISKFIAATNALGDHHSSDSNSLKLDFLNALEYLYASTPEYECFDDVDQSGQLRFEAVKLAKQYSDALFRRSSAGEVVYSQAKSLLHEYPDFAIDMALTSSGSSSMALIERKMSLVPTQTVTSDYRYVTVLLSSATCPSLLLHDPDGKDTKPTQPSA